MEHPGECFVFHWVLAEDAVKQEYSHKTKLSYDCLEYDQEAYPADRGQDLFVACNKKALVVYKNGIKDLFCEFDVSHWGPSSLLLYKDAGTLFVGTHLGSVRLYPWPLDETFCPHSVFSHEKQQLTYSLP